MFIYYLTNIWTWFLCSLQMAKTQKNKATAHHLGLLKVDIFGLHNIFFFLWVRMIYINKTHNNFSSEDWRFMFSLSLLSYIKIFCVLNVENGMSNHLSSLSHHWYYFYYTLIMTCHLNICENSCITWLIEIE